MPAKLLKWWHRLRTGHRSNGWTLTPLKDDYLESFGIHHWFLVIVAGCGVCGKRFG